MARIEQTETPDMMGERCKGSKLLPCCNSCTDKELFVTCPFCADCIVKETLHDCRLDFFH